MLILVGLHPEQRVPALQHASIESTDNVCVM